MGIEIRKQLFLHVHPGEEVDKTWNGDPEVYFKTNLLFQFI